MKDLVTKLSECTQGYWHPQHYSFLNLSEDQFLEAQLLYTSQAPQAGRFPKWDPLSPSPLVLLAEGDYDKFVKAHGQQGLFLFHYPLSLKHVKKSLNLPLFTEIENKKDYMKDFKKRFKKHSCLLPFFSGTTEPYEGQVDVVLPLFTGLDYVLQEVVDYLKANPAETSAFLATARGQQVQFATDFLAANVHKIAIYDLLSEPHEVVVDVPKPAGEMPTAKIKQYTNELVQQIKDAGGYSEYFIVMQEKLPLRDHEAQVRKAVALLRSNLNLDQLSLEEVNSVGEGVLVNSVAGKDGREFVEVDAGSGGNSFKFYFPLGQAKPLPLFVLDFCDIYSISSPEDIKGFDPALYRGLVLQEGYEN